jgi:N-acetylmuramoyl-L-alanine amidase
MSEGFSADLAETTPPASQFKVVLDPGHGGSDLGATYENAFEKNLTLALALEVKRQLEIKKYPVLLTRSRDEDVSLASRTALANREKAKLFLSIHLNSPPPGVKKSPDGIETFILNNTSSQTSKRLADLENKGIKLTEGSEKSDDGDVNLILKDLTLDGSRPESKRIACHLQKELISVTKQKHRGIKQALFVVLLGAEMPSALVEAGFISSEKDRKLIQNEHGIRSIAGAFVRAIEGFRLQKDSKAARETLTNCLVREQPASEN